MGRAWQGFWLVLLFTAVTSCNQMAETDSAVENMAGSTAASDALEKAALETGTIMDARAIDPVGLYQRGHEAGMDSLCIGKGRRGEYPFGLSFTFAEREFCAGQGRVRQSGENLIFRFEKANECIVIGRYEGDRITLPGAVDIKCEAVCTQRGSLAGATLPRVSSTTGAGASTGGRDRQGEPLCP